MPVSQYLTLFSSYDKSGFQVFLTLIVSCVKLKKLLFVKQLSTTSAVHLPVSRIRIRDQGLGAFVTPGSWMGRKSASGSGIRDEQPGSYFLELRNHFFVFLGLKYLNTLMRIRDPGWRQFGSGIRDKRPGSATLAPAQTYAVCLQGIY